MFVRICLFTILLIPATHEVAPAAIRTFSFYVAPKGADTNPGSAAKPFQTLTQAQQAVRTARQTGGMGKCYVFLRGGNYELTVPLKFGPQDGGTEKDPVIYTVSTGEKATICGGKAISGWTLLVPGLATAEVPWQVEPQEAKPEVPAEGDKPAVPAVPEVVGVKWSFTELIVNRERVELVSLQTPPADATEIPEPGQWFLDVEHRKIYYRLKKKETPEQLEAFVPMVRQMIIVQGNENENPVKNLRFDGIRFFGNTQDKPEDDAPESGAAVSFQDAENCSMTKCTFDVVEEPTVFFGNQ